jgi:hypothetical protein
MLDKLEVVDDPDYKDPKRYLKTNTKYGSKHITQAAGRLNELTREAVGPKPRHLKLTIEPFEIEFSQTTRVKTIRKSSVFIPRMSWKPPRPSQ